MSSAVVGIQRHRGTGRKQMREPNTEVLNQVDVTTKEHVTIESAAAEKAG